MPCLDDNFNHECVLVERNRCIAVLGTNASSSIWPQLCVWGRLCKRRLLPACAASRLASRRLHLLRRGFAPVVHLSLKAREQQIRLGRWWAEQAGWGRQVGMAAGGC